MLIPTLTITRDSNVKKYFIYRDAIEKLSSNVVDYIEKTPIGYIDNTSVTTDLIEFMDNRGQIENPYNMNLNNPITINEPKLTCYKNIEYIDNRNNIFYKCYLEYKEDDVLNFYKVLAENQNEQISFLSDTAIIKTKQSVNDIKSSLECLINDSWVKIKEISLNTDFELFRFNSEEIKIIDSIFEDQKPFITTNDIEFDNRYINNKNTAIIKIKNVWHKNNESCHYRELKKFRISTTVGDNNYIYNENFLPIKDYCPIDKITILKKEMNTDDIRFNVSEEESGIDTFELIRVDGIYYSKEIGLQRLNERYITSPSSLVNSDNIYAQLSFMDQNVSPNKIYKYTLRFYNNIGQIINVITLLNDTRG